MRGKEMNFKILDLFCGAGGLSYGMHQNPHFQTVVALDVNEALAITLKNNMPDIDVIIGDIKDLNIKEKVRFMFLIAKNLLRLIMN